MKVPYLKQDGDAAVFTGTYMEAYIPLKTFEAVDAVTMGDTIRIFGIFNFKVFNKIDITDEDRAKAKLETFTLPSTMDTVPSEQEIKVLKLDRSIEGLVEEQYKVLKYYNGDLLVKNLNVISDVDNVDIFIKILNSAKIPRTIPYDALPKLLEKCIDINNLKSRVPVLVYETLMTEICRYYKDPSKPFRMVIGADKGNAIGQNDYVPMRIRGIAQNNSAYTAITFEDFDTSATSAVNKKRYGEHSNISPIEKILKF